MSSTLESVDEFNRVSIEIFLKNYHKMRDNRCRGALSRSNLNAKEAPQTYDELNNELIQLLECPICFEYTTPPINQCLQGHIICNTCRQRVTTCPTCRTIFQESRNLIMEKVGAYNNDDFLCILRGFLKFCTFYVF